ncbi:ATP-dependent DNA helicase PIF1-like [Neltuma alba]|uniref:ATP-dependent DNA helicase PIF1-like n=1 Tax=Neltuma alba TaxID=207710 RepID=UPI0010A510D6|nr:ATP-dependent DNA helicase PIF1-like [Prosopis alba]
MHPNYLTERAILAPTTDVIDQINDYMLSLLPGDSVQYLSSDSVSSTDQDSSSFQDLYSTEFLNTINCSGMPPHKLSLKVGIPVMLLRNIDQSAGLCNGTRLRITYLGKNFIRAVTLNGTSTGDQVLIHRMDMNPSETTLPFRMTRRQFPFIISFAMTINKSQGHSLTNVGLYLPRPVFTHRQLYVALSRVRNVDGLKILILDSDSKPTNVTRNVVYREVFQNVHLE